MRATVIPALAVAMVVSGAAWAQSSSQQGTQSGGSHQTMMQKGSSQTTGQTKTMSQQKLRDALDKAGFSNVQILDTAYLVQAQTQDGETVIMMINPPSASAMQGGTGGMMGSSGSTGNSSSSTSSSGSGTTGKGSGTSQ